MKIPEYADIRDTDPVVISWNNAAALVSMESGIFVDVIIKRRNSNMLNGPIDEILFRVMDHEFSGLRDLKKALDNKAFL